MSEKRFVIAELDTIEDSFCPCGTSKRAFMDEEEGVASLHVTTIKEDSKVHYHKKMTEIYYVLEGEGHDGSGWRIPFAETGGFSDD